MVLKTRVLRPFECNYRGEYLCWSDAYKSVLKDLRNSVNGDGIIHPEELSNP